MNTFNVIQVKGYSCPTKWLLNINGEPVLFANTKARVNKCIRYVNGEDDLILDGSIRKLLDHYRDN